MEKGSVLHNNLTSIVYNLICKVNKHVALRLRLDSMAVSKLLSRLQYQKYFYLRSFYFRNFANSSERKELTVFTSKFQLQVYTFSFENKLSQKKITFSPLSYGRMFSYDNDRHERLHFRCEQYCIILPSRNKSFSRNPFEFFHIRESLVS